MGRAARPVGGVSAGIAMKKPNKNDGIVLTQAQKRARRSRSIELLPKLLDSPLPGKLVIRSKLFAGTNWMATVNSRSSSEFCSPFLIIVSLCARLKRIAAKIKCP